MTAEEIKAATKTAKFEVPGAGEILISYATDWECKSQQGFSFAVTWGKNGPIGGVLPKEEALKLARHILDNLNAH